jgi:hypothetical protein
MLARPKGAQMRPRITLFVSLVIFAVYQGNAAASGFKDDVAAGYKDRCIEVRTNKGQDKYFVLSVCECEANVLKDNFTTYELLMADARKQQGKEVLTKEQVIDFRKKLKSCSK